MSGWFLLQLRIFTLYIILFYTMVELLSDNDKKFYAFIRSRIVHGLGNPTLREINKLTGKSSPRSAVLVLERLEKALLRLALGDLLKAGEILVAC